MNKTICYKVNRAIELLELAIKTSDLDISLMGNILHDIRKDAQTMENGLKQRKQAMIEASVEEKYQKSKNKTTKGINKIKYVEKQTKKKADYEIIIKEKNKIIYQQNIFAGVFSFVEELKNIDENGNLDGTTQRLVFGHPLAYWFAFDQLRQNIEAKKIDVTIALKNAVMQNKFIKPEIREKIIQFANQI